MADASLPGRPHAAAPDRLPLRKWSRLPALPAFQAWCARMPLLRRIVRREGEAMFDLVAGFCHSQILQAFVKLRLPPLLLTHRMTVSALAREAGVPVDRMQVLMNAATAIGLTKRRGDHYQLTTRGTALAGVPGLQGMIAHHDVLYRDLADPVAFFRGEVDTELAAFWPYVFGADGAVDPTVTQTYSALMADSQGLVAADTIAAVNWSGVTHVMDVGGGTGAFLAALGAAEVGPQLSLFDLPAVVPEASARFEQAGLSDRVTIHAGSFRDDPLPRGADLISLVRVLYDHADDTVAALLGAVFDALPAGGRLVVSEPMTGATRPERAGDAYFALYCMAMRTGRARSSAEISKLIADAGFSGVRVHRSRRPFVTSVVTAVKSI